MTFPWATCTQCEGPFFILQSSSLLWLVLTVSFMKLDKDDEHICAHEFECQQKSYRN